MANSTYLKLKGPIVLTGVWTEIFQKGVRWTFGRESNLNFWYDNWSNLRALRQVIQGTLSSELVNLKVKDVVSTNGWDWAITSFDFLDSVKQELQAIPFAMASHGEDKLTWKESDHGIFNLGSAYKIATNPENVDLFRAATFRRGWRIMAPSSKKLVATLVPRVQFSPLLYRLSGSIGTSPGLARGGDLIQDEAGNWVVGFARKIGKTTSFLAKIWALHDGLNLCLNHNFAAVEVEIDAKAIVDAISNLNYTNLFVSPLMDDYRLLASRIPQIRFRHCYREANRCVDALARLGGLQSIDFAIFVSPPMGLLIC
ncbi:hypothetical protein SO802_005942 [Lithocarpus litseifolius]|uniref:RNase H type-1 domain-containing protein n=1 Tax=Lithocarpus litseifolius TaxID=425828 RepID=A0AAW2DL26_9ROSI